jgi:hypothetical protein
MPEAEFEPCVRAIEDSSCLRQLGYRDLQEQLYFIYNFGLEFIITVNNGVRMLLVYSICSFDFLPI